MFFLQLSLFFLSLFFFVIILKSYFSTTIIVFLTALIQLPGKPPLYFNLNYEIHIASIPPAYKIFQQLFGQPKGQIFTTEACSLNCPMLITAI